MKVTLGASFVKPAAAVVHSGQHVFPSVVVLEIRVHCFEMKMFVLHGWFSGVFGWRVFQKAKRLMLCNFGRMKYLFIHVCQWMNIYEIYLRIKYSINALLYFRI